MRFCLLILLACGASSVSAQALQNPNFTANIFGWRFFLDQGSGGIIEWDATSGAPDVGSARVGNYFVGARYDALGQCLTPAPSAWVLLRAQVRADILAGNRCRLRAVYADLMDCAVGSNTLLEASTTLEIGSASFQTLSVALTPPVGAQSMAVILAHERDDAASPGYSDCRYDSIELLPDAVLQAGFDS